MIPFLPLVMIGFLLVEEEKVDCVNKLNLYITRPCLITKYIWSFSQIIDG